MNKQEIFDKVALHLITQGVPAKTVIRKASGDQPFCSYWDKERGLKCAIGCLIPEELYTSAMEGAGGVYANVIVRRILNLVGIYMDDMEGFLSVLQNIHDHQSPDVWKSKLREVAFFHKLEIPEFLKG